VQEEAEEEQESLKALLSAAVAKLSLVSIVVLIGFVGCWVSVFGRVTPSVVLKWQIVFTDEYLVSYPLLPTIFTNFIRCWPRSGAS